MADIDTDATLTEVVDRGARSTVPLTGAESKICNCLASLIWFAGQDDKLPHPTEAGPAAFDETRSADDALPRGPVRAAQDSSPVRKTVTGTVSPHPLSDVPTPPFPQSPSSFACVG